MIVIFYDSSYAKISKNHKTLSADLPACKRVIAYDDLAFIGWKVKLCAVYPRIIVNDHIYLLYFKGESEIAVGLQVTQDKRAFFECNYFVLIKPFV